MPGRVADALEDQRRWMAYAEKYEGRTVLATSDATIVQAAVGSTAVLGATEAATQAVPVTPGDDPSQPNRTRTYVIVLVILLVLLAVVGFLLARQLGYLGGSATVSVPDVVGQPVATATSTLQSDGFVVKDVSEVSTETPGTVLSTDPVKDSLVKKGATVTLSVATVGQTTVPQGITGVSLGTAESILTNAKLLYSTINQASTTVTKGNVISSDPASGTSIAQGGTVELVVSTGPTQVTVPGLAGVSQITAATTLGQVGLNVGTVTQAPSTQYGAGTVISTTPAVGTQVAPGTAVNLVVSSGPPPPTTTTTSSSTTTTTSPSSSTTTSSSTSTTSTTAPKSSP